MYMYYNLFLTSENYCSILEFDLLVYNSKAQITNILLDFSENDTRLKSNDDKNRAGRPIKDQIKATRS